MKGRNIHLQPYGVAYTRLRARLLGANPVWYVDMTPAQRSQWAVAKALDCLRDDAIASGNLEDSDIGRILPFLEQMGEWHGSRSAKKEFWWEREWRSRGDFTFNAALDIAFLLCPECDHAWLLGQIEAKEISIPAPKARRIVLDPAWSLETMVAHMAGIPREDVAPFRAR